MKKSSNMPFYKTCYMNICIYLCVCMYVHIQIYLELSISKILIFFLPIKHLLIKHMFLTAQLCARHCTVLAVVRMILYEIHETVNPVAFGAVAVCLALCLTHSRNSKHIHWLILINTILAYYLYDCWHVFY